MIRELGDEVPPLQMYTGSWVNSQSDFPSLVICAAENSIQIFLVWTLALIFLVSKISILVVVFGIGVDDPQVVDEAIDERIIYIWLADDQIVAWLWSALVLL